MKAAYRFFLLTAILLALCSCSSLSPNSIVNTAIGWAQGNPSDVAKVQQVEQIVQAGSNAAQEITPPQEYYIGRAVAATVLTIYKPYDDQNANTYLNTLGSGLALASVLPETYKGYHFLIMDTDDINAFGAPSGFILVSRGLLRCAASEDEVAAILAHEIGHVSLKHGLKAISKARWTEAGVQLGKFAAQNSDYQVLRDLTSSFGNVIGDIVKTMVTSGYSRDLEKQADLEAVRILHDVGYDPQAMVRMLAAMKLRLKPGGQDFTKTHPDPEVRIAYVKDAIKAQTPVPAPSSALVKERQARFQAALSKI
ncbi:MAG: M48 family metalloprotease [Spirochaetia bacterium]|jgi:predicted Zn-dependent protease